MFADTKNINSLLGHIFNKITRQDDQIILEGTGDFILKHDQECCEDVYIEDICGDIEDILYNEIILAEEFSKNNPNASGSGTWSFYKIGTNKGSITIRFYGSSNGSYSENAVLTEYAKNPNTLQGLGFEIDYNPFEN